MLNSIGDKGVVLFLGWQSDHFHNFNPGSSLWFIQVGGGISLLSSSVPENMLSLAQKGLSLVAVDPEEEVFREESTVMYNRDRF